MTGIDDATIWKYVAEHRCERLPANQALQRQHDRSFAYLSARAIGLIGGVIIILSAIAVVWPAEETGSSEITGDVLA